MGSIESDIGGLGTNCMFTSEASVLFVRSPKIMSIRWQMFAKEKQVISRLKLFISLHLNRDTLK